MSLAAWRLSLRNTIVWVCIFKSNMVVKLIYIYIRIHTGARRSYGGISYAKMPKMPKIQCRFAVSICRISSINHIRFGDNALFRVSSYPFGLPLFVSLHTAHRPARTTISYYNLFKYSMHYSIWNLGRRCDAFHSIFRFCALVGSDGVFTFEWIATIFYFCVTLSFGAHSYVAHTNANGDSIPPFPQNKYFLGKKEENCW